MQIEGQWLRFSAYLKGIETYFSASSNPSSVVFSVPKRNWNLFSYPLGLAFSLVFSITLKELKPDQVSFCNSSKFSAHLKELKQDITEEHRSVLKFQRTKRNWNMETYKVTVANDLVFSVPKRNWNPAMSAPEIGLGTFSAYLKGLKRYEYSYAAKDGSMFSAYLKELKPRWYCHRQATFSGFSAYLKELKQNGSLPYLPGERVFSVPKRNWNWMIRWWYFAVVLEFSAYLKGIET